MFDTLNINILVCVYIYIYIISFFSFFFVLSILIIQLIVPIIKGDVENIRFNSITVLLQLAVKIQTENMFQKHNAFNI